MPNFTEQVDRIFALRRQRLAQQLSGSPISSSAMTSLTHEHQMTRNIADVVQRRLEYLRQTYDESAKELEAQGRKQMWTDISDIVGTVGGTLASHYLGQRQMKETQNKEALHKYVTGDVTATETPYSDIYNYFTGIPKPTTNYQYQIPGLYPGQYYGGR